MRPCQRAIALWFLAGLLACGAGFPAVIDPTDIADLHDGRPRISRMRDLGAVHIGRAGPLRAESDGQFTIGEFVLIEGSGFGKQPTVGIAGRPAEVLWRTEGGGIVTQIPTGCGIGEQTVSLQSGGGHASATLTLSRLAVVLDGRRGEVRALRISRGTDGAPTVAAVSSPLRIAGAQALAMSFDGAAAYVLSTAAAQSSVAIIDLMAPGGPQVSDTRQLGYAARLLAAAEHAAVLTIVGDDQVTVWDIREPRRPAAWAAAALPASAQRARAAALHPEGGLLALAQPEDNQVVLLDVKPGLTVVNPRQVATIQALPGLRQPLVHGLRFASDGGTLWLSSGDNPDSLAAGHQPTRVTAIELQQPDLGMAVLKTVELRDAGAPGQLALARTPPLGAGTTIRTPKEKATVFLVTAAAAAQSAPARAALWRSDLAGQITPLFSSKELLVGLDVSPDARLAVTEHVASGPASRTLAVTDLLNKRNAALSLGPADDADLTAPFDRLQILLQP